MTNVPDIITKLVDLFAKFPGIGKKTAQRMTFHLLKMPAETAQELAHTILDMKTNIRSCSQCGGITVSDPCTICSDSKRDPHLICVVEEPVDLYAFERLNSFKGLYHVLGGVLSPLDGIGPEDLNIESLLTRLEPETEVVLATNPSVEGEATALYLAKVLKEKGAKVTRLARGIPVGGDLEYTDDATLLRAMEGRTAL